MIEIIPAIDIIDGRCVRLSQGDYSKVAVYDARVADIARQYEDIGIKRIHVVDLDGAKESFPVNLKTLESIASATSLDIEWGGGIKNLAALDSVFDAGADRAVCGSVAVTSPDTFGLWLERYGCKKIILGADIRDGLVAIGGWLKTSDRTVDDLIRRFIPSGLSQVICTDISKDGMLKGPSTELYTQIQSRYREIDITVSGGVGSMDDIVRLSQAGLRYVIIGKALYENRITLNEIKQWLQNE